MHSHDDCNMLSNRFHLRLRYMLFITNTIFFLFFFRQQMVSHGMHKKTPKSKKNENQKKQKKNPKKVFYFFKTSHTHQMCAKNLWQNQMLQIKIKKLKY